MSVTVERIPEEFSDNDSDEYRTDNRQGRENNPSLNVVHPLMIPRRAGGGRSRKAMVGSFQIPATKTVRSTDLTVPRFWAEVLARCVNHPRQGVVRDRRVVESPKP